MATAYVAADTYCASDYCEVELAGAITILEFPTPIPGEYPAASPDPARVTLTASPPTTNFPRGPYGTVLAVVLRTHAGTRIFSAVHVDPLYTVPPALGRYCTLLDLSTISWGQSGSGNTLITRVNTLVLPSFTVTFSNEDGFWSRLVATEYLLGMTVSLYEDYGNGQFSFEGRGEIFDVELTRKRCTLRVGA
jgi:hypothetical protein